MLPIMNETPLPYKLELGGAGDSDASVAEVNAMLHDAEGEVFGFADNQFKNGLSEIMSVSHQTLGRARCRC